LGSRHWHGGSRRPGWSTSDRRISCPSSVRHMSSCIRRSATPPSSPLCARSPRPSAASLRSEHIRA
jgi:hypothetical protein